ncbi:MAG: DUF6498-containing protein [Euryarchaeota archaeon]|nr:DUF6498-containing protein [Euryarchaeota archaeon]
MNIAEFGRTIQHSSSTWILILTNIFPIFGVLFIGYNILSIFLLYWAESGIIGFYSILKIIVTIPQHTHQSNPFIRVITIFGKIFMVPFFCIHFGGFMFGHLLFILAFFAPTSLPSVGFNILSAVTPFLQQIWFGLLLLFISHGYSFYSNYIRAEEYKQIKTSQMPMMQPYARIIVMQIAIIFGGMLYFFSGQQLVMLLLLIVLKIGFDLRAHVKERKKFQSPTPKNILS